ncbi:MAG: zf-HC2 domain-containing protein [Candidatus Brocadiae bacterium]|nr:zf-HC2 domain-containing protein [Candidatus Brocadiia bacterium]
MNCQEARKIVHLFVDGALDPRANVDVLAHLNMCGACTERFTEARRFEDFVRDRLKAGPAPDGVRARISIRIGELSAPWPVRMLGGLRRRPVAAFSGMAAVLAVSLVSWQACGFFLTCPYVRGVVNKTDQIVDHKITRIPDDAQGPLRHLKESMPDAPVFAGMVNTGTYAVDMDPVYRDAIAFSYRMDHCPDDRVCAVLFMVKAPGMQLHEHDAVVKQGKTFTRWEYDDSNVVCWKDEKRGVFCLLVCKRKEMEREALLDYASLAATVR